MASQTQQPGSSVASRTRRPVLVESLLVLAGGLAIGIAWGLGEPAAQSVTDPTEAVVSGDAAFAVAAIVVGLVTAVLLIRRPGPNPASRLLRVLVGACLGSVLAWGVGLGLNAAPLQARGVLLLWPFVVALATLITSVITLTIHGE